MQVKLMQLLMYVAKVKKSNRLTFFMLIPESDFNPAWDQLNLTR